MKNALLIIGIVSIIACVLSLLYAALCFAGYRNVLDGSPELYSRLHQRTIIFTITGIVLALIAAGCLIFRSRL